jgi:hypothetical protein
MTEFGYVFTSQETPDEYRTRTGSAAAPPIAGPLRIFRLVRVLPNTTSGSVPPRRS